MLPAPMMPIRDQYLDLNPLVLRRHKVRDRLLLSFSVLIGGTVALRVSQFVFPSHTVEGTN